MSKINILKPAVFNKIAAGEVVERPKSIVKELVENAIDASATKIDIEVSLGGISKIVVSDNGVGMAKEDLMIAYMPHTTSKIKVAEDLNNINTLGFRGEALASISAVSKLNITTKTKDDVVGNYINIQGGEVVDSGEIGTTTGTRVTVQDLFFNVPVRAKFLKKPKQEEGEITSLLTRLILANPNVAIKYVADDVVIFNSQGTGLNDAIFAVYGKNTVTNIIPVDYKTDDGYCVYGFVSKTNYFKPNRTYQTLVINKRYVTDYLVSQAISRAFEPYMLKQSFPFYVLFLDMPVQDLDVNVHPNKMEVRFANAQHIFGVMYNAINNAIKTFLAAKADDDFNGSSFNTPSNNAPHMTTADVLQPSTAKAEFNQFLDELKQAVKNPNDNKDEALHDQSYQPGEILIEKLQTTSFFNTSTQEETPKAFEPKPVQQQILTQEDLIDDTALSLKVIGKVFNTFVIVEVDDKMYLIDQHAAHERLLYDNLVQAVQKNEVKKQGLMLPFVLDVNSSESEFINKNLQVLNDLGFEIEPFGNNSFRVSTIPAALADLNIGLFFNSILSELNTFLTLKTEDILKDKLAQHACKHAVKGGDDLNRDELVVLIKRISSGQMTMQCPHGRPFVVEITRNQIDKWFKRVL